MFSIWLETKLSTTGTYKTKTAKILYTKDDQNHSVLLMAGPFCLKKSRYSLQNLLTKIKKEKEKNVKFKLM